MHLIRAIAKYAIACYKLARVNRTELEPTRLAIAEVLKTSLKVSRILGGYYDEP